MDHVSKEIGANIRKFRKAFNMTTTELGDLSGTSQSTISQIENGRSTNIETLIKICEILKITLHEILPVHVFPNLKEEHPKNSQLLNFLNQMTDDEVKSIQILLTSKIIPVLKSIAPIIKTIDELDEQERELLSNLLNSKINNS